MSMDFGEFSDVSLDTNDTENYKSCDTDTSASLSINGSSCSIETQELHNLNLDYDNSYQNDHHESSSSSSVTGKATFGCDAEANKEIHTGNQAPALGQLQWHFDSNRKGSEKLSGYLTTNNITQHGSESYEYSLNNKPVAAQGVTNGVISNSHKSKELDLLEDFPNHLPSSISSTTELTDDEASSTSTVSRSKHSPSDLELDAQSDISQVPSEAMCSAEEDNTSCSSSTPPSRSRRRNMKQHSKSSFDELLFDLYDKSGGSSIRLSISSSVDGSSTDCSSVSECIHANEPQRVSHTSTTLQKLGVEELKELMLDLSNKVNQKNTQLVKCLRNRERHRNRAAKHFDMVTAIIQAWSTKSSADAKMKFTIEPPAGDANFAQWRDAITSLIRRPVGLPSHFRSSIWLSLATRYIKDLRIDWNKVLQFAFNDKCNPDDDALGAQIVKDLHRTGCSTFSGIENEEDRVILQRVLLGYARWNKVTGYCQGFNVLAAFILNVTNKNEADALKIMVYLVDHMLPKEYFAHNLRALTVDMAVFRTYLAMKLPKLSAHLTKLQQESCDDCNGGNVEPPLTNVFTMQWFLTMFATCLPMATVLKIWDCVMLDGSEILIRAALALWTKLAKKIIRVKSADEFYMTMGSLTQQLMKGEIVTTDELIRSIYNMAPIPLPKLTEIREKFMYDITPFSADVNSHKSAHSEEESADDMHDVTKKDLTTHHTMDVAMLRRQYAKLTRRQRKASLLMMAPVASTPPTIVPNYPSPVVNHLFVGKEMSEKKQVSTPRSRSVSVGGQVESVAPALSDHLASRLDFYDSSQQDSRPMLRSKAKKQKSVQSQSVPISSSEAASSITEPEVVNQEVKKVVRQTSDTSDEFDGDHATLAAHVTTLRREIRRQHSTASDSSSISTDSVFTHSILNQNGHQGSSNSLSQRPYSKEFIPSIKPFSPFPKPATGILSAKKAKIGVELGLYKPESALAYMSPAERKQFLREGKHFTGRMAMSPTSSLW